VVSLAPALQPSQSAYRHDGAGGELGANYVDGTKMKRAIHYLRIGWTVFFAVLCVLMIVLRMRSFQCADSLGITLFPLESKLILNSLHAQLQVHVVPSSQWWQSRKSQAVFVPGKGYQVPSSAGYFDGEGTPLPVYLRTMPQQFAGGLISYQFLVDSYYDRNSAVVPNAWGFGLSHSWGALYIFPHWCPALLAIVLAGLPWLQLRFRLRTLLIFVTVVSLFLGLLIYLTKH
jgi:hypothetical protein